MAAAPPINLEPYVRRAEQEWRDGKTLKSIQAETALVWCGRAIVAARAGQMADAVEYAHEAIEHAALSGDDSMLVAIRRVLFSLKIPA